MILSNIKNYIYIYIYIWTCIIPKSYIRIENDYTSFSYKNLYSRFNGLEVRTSWVIYLKMEVLKD